MKNLLLILFTAVVFNACNNDDDGDTTTNPIDQLPPATQTGEQTFGCLINGEPFVPPSFGSNAPNAFYQFVGSAYTLGISGGNIGGGANLKSVNLGGIDVEPLSQIIYILIEEESGNFFGNYNIGGGITFNGVTGNQNPGTLNVTKFDSQNFTISGTFEFTVLDYDGNEINITDGRFDLNYTN